MNGVKRMCKKAAKIAFGVVVGVGLIGFVKGLLIGYYIGRHKSCQLETQNVTDKTG